MRWDMKRFYGQGLFGNICCSKGKSCDQKGWLVVGVVALVGNPDRTDVSKVKLSPETLSHMITEIAILKGCTHSNVVQYIESYVVDNRLWLVMEFMGRGCLADLLAEFDQVKMKPEHIAYVAREALKVIMTR